MQRMRVPTDPVLKSRWTALVIVFGLAAVIVLWVLGYRKATAWSLFILLTSVAIGLLRPDLTLWLFDAWDSLALKARRGARLWLTGVVFVSIGAVGLLGSRLQRKRPTRTESGWYPKKRLPDGSHTGEADTSHLTGTRSGWVRRYAVWAWHSGNVWSWSLLPSLMLLKVVEGESQGSLGGDVYTLY